MSGIISDKGKIFNSLQWKIIFVYLMLILFALQLISVYLVQSLEKYYLSSYKESLVNQARLLALFMEPDLGESQGWTADTVRLASKYGDLGDVEIIILDHDALVAGTSGNQNLIGRRLIREEITRALTGNLSDNLRYDETSKIRRYYLAYPVIEDQDVLGVVYLSGSLKVVDDTLNEVKTILLTGVLLALVVSFFIGAVLTRTITSPIKDVTDKALNMASGDFGQKIEVQATDEIGRLGETFNYLAQQLSQVIGEMSSEKSKVEAIINNMTDGIVALDDGGLVIHINPAARQLIRALKLKVPALGRSGASLLRKLVGSARLHRFNREQEPLTTEVCASGPDCTLEVKIAPFKTGKGKLSGTLIVLHDITRERELTRRQEEFVADVSHELRTPLATVKSYVETLLNGAAEEAETRSNFLAVLSKETDRMVNMVKDLLVLSQMDNRQVDWQKAEVNLQALAEEAVDQLQQKLTEELPRLRVNIPADLIVLADRDQLIRVFANLLNNAARYTPARGEISLDGLAEEGLAKIYISDTGRGIPETELPHVFERFYRVEKTRSRDYGGTGLGLSIARKIIEGHGGQIFIHSVTDMGTRVLFTLPLKSEGGRA